MTRKLILLLGVAFALVVAAPATAATTTVQITKIAFVPANASVDQGDQVTWSNSDTDNHQVVSQAGGWASPILKAGDTWTHTFEKAGKFAYVDSQDKTLKGSVTVKATPGTVTLDASASAVTFGGHVTLSGAISSKQANQQVEVFKVECGKSSQSLTKVATATTTAGGGFTYSTQPVINTSYQVKWSGATSPLVQVDTKPRIRLGKIAPRRYSVRVYAGSSLAGRLVTLQRWDARAHLWKAMRTATLRQGADAVDPTVVSSVTLTAKVKPRVKLRIVMTQRQVGSCYLPSVSNAVLA